MVSLNIYSTFSNLSANSSQSPPIYLQNLTGSKSSGIFRLNPGGGYIGAMHLILNFGVLNL